MLVRDLLYGSQMMTSFESELTLEMIKALDSQIKVADDMVKKFTEVREDLLKEKQQLLDKLVEGQDK